MNPIDRRVVDFINNHHVLTLATSSNNKPYCCNCFYIFLEDSCRLVFTSDMDTRHVNDVLENNSVGGSIVLETNLVGKVQGVQFNGIMSQPEGEILEIAKDRYLKRFPIAQIMKTTLWIVDLTFIKFTDNRLGFGKKLIWEK